MGNKIFHFIKYTNYSKKEYECYKKEIDRQNYKRFKCFTVITAFVGILSFICSSLLSVIASTRFIYAIVALLSIGTFILNNYLKDKRTALYFVYYIFVIGIFISLSIAGVNYNRESTASVICGVYIFLPILLMDIPYRFSVILCLCTLFICIDSFYVKEVSLALIDCVNCTLFNIFSCILSYYFWDTRLRQMTEKGEIASQRDTDYLTGLRSRIVVEAHVNAYLTNQKEVGKGALLIIDLDNFKRVNDKFGHLMGDRVLVIVSDILRKQFEGAIISRIGGDEFVIFIEDIPSQSDIEKKAQMVIEKIRNVAVQTERMIGCSIGIVFTRPDKNYRDLFDDADIAMYQAKTAGKNQYKIYLDHKE